MRKSFIALLIALTFSTAGDCAPRLQRITLYLQNPTSGSINYRYQKGGDDWYNASIRPGYTNTMTGFAPHKIRFDNGRRQTRQYTLQGGRNYFFRWQNKTLDLKHR
jgi:hypothetical protein